MCAASTGRTHGCTRSYCINVKFLLAKSAPSTHGYELPWTGIVKAKPSPLELHALITAPEHLNLTQLDLKRQQLLTAFSFLTWMA